MQLISLLVLGLLGALFLYIVVRMSLSIGTNLQQGMAVRESIALQMKSLRLQRMLTALGIDSNRYLHTESVAEITRQMRNCQGCGATETCDSVLQDKQRLVVSEVNFCPNQPSLARIRMAEGHLN